MRRHPARAMYDPQPMYDPQHQAKWARQISSGLRSVLLDTLGLAAAIEWQVRQFQKCTGIPCELKANDGAGFDLPEDHAATIFDLYNEALCNAARRAEARRVAIALTITPREASMVVEVAGARNASVRVSLPVA